MPSDIRKQLRRLEQQNERLKRANQAKSVQRNRKIQQELRMGQKCNSVRNRLRQDTPNLHQHTESPAHVEHDEIGQHFDADIDDDVTDDNTIERFSDIESNTSSVRQT